MAARQLAQWTHELSFSALPDSVVQAAIKSFYNYVGVAIGGQDHEAIQIALNSSFAFLPASGPSSLLGSEKTSDPLQAALINGFAAHIHDYDDTHLATVIHPTAAVASALVAYTEYASSQGTSTSGQDFILALIAGMEVECILGLSVYPSHYNVGWHITSTVGSIGAAVAVGKAMKLPVEQLQHAIGVSSASATGMREHFGSHTKAFGVGKTAQSGLQAAFLAQHGLTASETAIDGKRGWMSCVCPEQDVAREKLKNSITIMVSMWPLYSTVDSAD
jgi:aconitate decarboxylase